jgi:GrpB-like predicted nucleotidyltransferase (UPF0157 family)
LLIEEKGWLEVRMGKIVLVVKYDARWPAEFERAAEELRGAMREALTNIHHIGSTSVPGLQAKPVIDMLATVRDLDAADRCRSRMQALGYEAMGEFGIAGRRYFRRNDARGVRTHQLHAFEAGSPHVERHLAFRDYLRGHADIAARYAALKQALAERFHKNIEGYMDGKDEFIKEVEARAVEWRRGMRN